MTIDFRAKNNQHLALTGHRKWALTCDTSITISLPIRRRKYIKAL